MTTTHPNEQGARARRGIGLRSWQRLLWKEWRESWPVLAAGVLLPLLLLPALRNPRWEGYLGGIAFSAVALISILITLWAANRVSGRMPGKPGTRGVLPLTGLTRWLDTYLPAALVPAIIGVPLGVLVVVASGRTDAPGDFVFAMVLFLLVNYALSTVLARVFSPIPGILAGVAWLFLAFDEVTMDARMGDYAVVIAAMFLASLPWEALAAKHRYGLGRFAAILVMAGVIGGVLVYPQFWRDTTRQGEVIHQRAPSQYLADDAQGLVLEYEKSLPPPDGKRMVSAFQLSDYTLGRVVGRVSLDDDVQPLGFLGLTGALFLQQQPGNSARLLAWDARSDQVHEVARLALEADIFSKRDIAGNISPDGRYALILLAPEDPLHGADLWLADLQRHKAALAVPDSPSVIYWYLDHPVWQDERVLLSRSDAVISIDLQTMRGRYLNYPMPGREER